MICFVRDGKASLVTRRGNDWTDRFPKIAAAVEQLGIGDAILDGEIVAVDADGSADFQRLQNSMRHGNDSRIVYYLFDLLYLGGHDLRHVALFDRKQWLSQLIDQWTTLACSPVQRPYLRVRVERCSRPLAVMAWRGLSPSGEIVRMLGDERPTG